MSFSKLFTVRAICGSIGMTMVLRAHIAHRCETITEKIDLVKISQYAFV